MARKLRLWTALLQTLLGGLAAALCSALQLGKAQKIQNAAGGSLQDADQLDFHWLPYPLPGDADRDRILSSEERAYGILDPLSRDQNANGRLDGADFARCLLRAIGVLPVWDGGDPPPTEIVRTPYMMFGTEDCEVCGERLNMGFLRITNPLKDAQIDLPYVSLHYLQHGSFVYDGTLHQGRIDLEQLIEVLGDSHLLPVASDSDGDLLEDVEELAIGTDPLNGDEDGALVADGKEKALAMREAIELLPQGPLPDQVYRIDYMFWGGEDCEVCGEYHNMGWVEVTDPIGQRSVTIPYIGLHYMEHGSLSYDGTLNDGRVDVATLHEILEDA